MTARPATTFDALDFAGPRSLLRKALLYQVRNFPAEVMERDGRALALVMFHWHRRRRVEVAIHFRPEAQAHMRALILAAQLTLSRLGQSGVMAFCVVRETDARAQRMARLAGFRHAGFRNGTIWIAEKPHADDERAFRRRQQGGREGPGGSGGTAPDRADAAAEFAEPGDAAHGAEPP